MIDLSCIQTERIIIQIYHPLVFNNVIEIRSIKMFCFLNNQNITSSKHGACYNPMLQFWLSSAETLAVQKHGLVGDWLV